MENAVQIGFSIDVIFERIRNFSVMTNNSNSMTKDSNKGDHFGPKPLKRQKIDIADIKK